MYFFCSGHQKEANCKDCLLIIDHVTGEITLEKLSSQIMVKKTRSEKPDPKNASQDSSINITPTNSRPHTPINSTKHETGKSGINKKAVAGNKVAGTKYKVNSKYTVNIRNKGLIGRILRKSR